MIKVLYATLLLTPTLALAQAALATSPVTYKGWDLTPLIGLAITLITALLGFLGKKVASWSAASEAESKAKTAQIRLAEIGFAMIGDLWTQFSAEFQLRIADGRIDANDRIYFGEMIKANIEKYTSKAELEKITTALGLPLPGIIARIVEYMIDRLTKAHDPEIMDVATAAYPLKLDVLDRTEPVVGTAPGGSGG